MSLEETIKRIAGKNLPVNEETAKRQAIEPILEALGWDVADKNGNQEVQFEYTIRMRGQSGSGKADIALLEPGGSRRCVCLVEAKSPDKNLDDHVDQLNNYAKIEGVDIAVLTNVKEWRIFYPGERGRIDNCQIARFEITDTPGELAIEMRLFLSRSNLLSGKAAAAAKQRLKELQQVENLKEALPRLWGEMLYEPDEDLLELVAGKAAKQKLEVNYDQITAMLRREEIVPPKIPLPPTTKPRPVPVSKPIAYTLWGTTKNVKSSIDLLVNVAQDIYQKHPDDFHLLEDGFKSKNRLYMSRNPAALKGTNRPVGTSGFYVFTHMSAFQIHRRCEHFLEFFGHPASDLHVRYQKQPD